MIFNFVKIYKDKIVKKDILKLPLKFGENMLYYI